MLKMSNGNQATSRSINPRSTIDDFRGIVREQSSASSFNSPTEDDLVDVRVKKYPPLPDIHGVGPFYRTETHLEKSRQTSNGKKQMFYHFARSQRAPLPALNPHSISGSFLKTMDLDENLPECYSRIPQRVQTYTSPNDRLSSPIKRPSAPSPPTSAQIKRLGPNSAFSSNTNNDDDDDDEEYDERFDSETEQIQSLIFQEHFSRYAPQNSDEKFSNFNKNNHNNLLILDDPSTSFSALDLQR